MVFVIELDVGAVLFSDSDIGHDGFLSALRFAEMVSVPTLAGPYRRPAREHPHRRRWRANWPASDSPIRSTRTRDGIARLRPAARDGAAPFTLPCPVVRS